MQSVFSLLNGEPIENQKGVDNRYQWNKQMIKWNEHHTIFLFYSIQSKQAEKKCELIIKSKKIILLGNRSKLELASLSLVPSILNSYDIKDLIRGLMILWILSRLFFDHDYHSTFKHFVISSIVLVVVHSQTCFHILLCVWKITKNVTRKMF